MGEPAKVTDLIPAQRRALDRARQAGPQPARQPDPPARRNGIPPWVPKRFWDATLGTLDGQVGQLAHRWAGTCDSNVLLLGATGTGKTWAEVAMAREAWARGASVWMTTAHDLLESLKPGRDDRAHGRARGVDVLLLDDVGAERLSEWAAGELYGLVNARWLDVTPTLVTSNLSPEVLVERVGSRVFSRLYDGAARLTLAGADRRKAER
jgi:DNA replication protein DnaC